MIKKQYFINIYITYLRAKQADWELRNDCFSCQVVEKNICKLLV